MKCRLGEIAIVTMGQSPQSEFYNSNGFGMPFMQGNRTFGLKYPTVDTYTTKVTKIAQPNDVIMSVRAPVGDLNITKSELCLGRGLCSIRMKNGNNNYLFHLLKYYNKELTNRESGTVFGSVNKRDIEMLEVDVHEDNNQIVVEKILSDLDNKIELNNHINKNLEEQIQTYFKKYILNLDNSFVNTIETQFGLVSNDFMISRISDLSMTISDYVANGSFASLKANVTLFQDVEYAYFIRNTDLKSNNFDVYVNKHSYDFLSKTKLFGGEIIISNVGDVGSVFLCPKLDKPMTLGNNIIMLRPNDNLRDYIYCWFKWFQGKDLIKGITGGSAQPKFNKTDFKSLPILIPDDNTLKQFNKIIGPMFLTIESNINNNKKLVTIRDILLPKLMSGEIDVTDLDN